MRSIAALAAGTVAAAAALAGCGGGTAVATATVEAAPPPKTSGAGPLAAALAFQRALIRVVEEVSPSVVQIQDRSGLGSGIVFDSRGDIVTNNHVVAGGGPYSVTTAKGKRIAAKLVGAFPPDDLAVVRVSGAGLKPATFADSSALRVGDLAIAIGNPLGLRSSVTQGIVSAFRAGIAEGGGVALPTMIQTSAPINPGNSGGALVDIRGRVIGIPTLAATDPQLGGTAAGIGFAIPSNLVKDIATQIVAHGHVVDSHRAYLGIHPGDTGGQGVYVGKVVAGGPAAKAGMRAGDVIASVAGRATATVDALTSVLAEQKPGKSIAVQVIRQNGSRTTLHVTLGTYPGGG